MSSVIPKSTPLPKKKKPKVKRTAFQRRSRQRQPGDSDTIPSFCESEAISESLYFKLKRLGKGPREMFVEGAVRISPAAKADWRREREAETQAKRSSGARENATATA
jgi:hypothetical protein